MGTENTTKSDESNAFGRLNKAWGLASNAFGHNNEAQGASSNAFGSENLSSADFSSTFGFSNETHGIGSTAIGTDNLADNDASLAIGAFNKASGESSAAIGHFATSSGTASVALGLQSIASGDGSVALGSGSIADRGRAVSVGATGAERQIIHVAAATQGTDAVNLNQLTQELGATLNTAKAYTDTTVATGGTAANAYTDDQVGHVRQDMEAGDAATLSAANAYTDQQLAGFDTAGLNQRFDRLDQQVGVLDSRVNTIGALSAAMSLAVPDGRVGGANQFSMGVGHFRDRQAVSVGYSRLVAPRASVRLSAAFANGENAAGVGFNVGW